MQIATYPDSFAPEPRIAAVEREQQRRNREIAVKAATAHIRAQIADERALAWWDRLQDILGPEPTTGQGWADRGLKCLELAQIEGVGLNPNACARYAEECARRAKWVDPAKYGDRLRVDTPPPPPRVLDVDKLTPDQRDQLRQLLMLAMPGGQGGVIEGQCERVEGEGDE